MLALNVCQGIFDKGIYAIKSKYFLPEVYMNRRKAIGALMGLGGIFMTASNGETAQKGTPIFGHTDPSKYRGISNAHCEKGMGSWSNESGDPKGIRRSWTWTS